MPLSLKRFLSAALLSAMSFASYAGTLTNVSVTPADSTPGATTTYTFQYTLDSDVNADEALFYVTFPNDFTVATGACDRIASITITPSPGLTICRGSFGSGNTVGFAVSTTVSGGISVPGGSMVEVVVNGVTNPSVAGNYYFDPALGIMSGTGIYTTQMMDPMFPMAMEKDTAPQQTVTIGSVSVVNGGCGTADSQVFSAAPAAALCATGTASSVTTNATTYTWACNGSGGGTNASCSANKGYDVTLSISPMSGGSASCTSNPVIHGGNTTCTPTASPGYSFVNWSGDCSGSTCVLNNVTSTRNPQANFALNTYNIATTVNPSTAGTITCTNNPVNHGDNSICTYTANSGYTFTNWSGDCTGATCNLNGVTGAKSVTANFTAPSFAITANVSPNGAGTASCTPNPVNGGSNSTCTASANSGYTFSGWTGDCTGSTCVLGFVAAAKTVTANFTSIATYSIFGSASPSAGGSVSCSSGISSGGNGTCSATANVGYSFTGWSGCPNVVGNSCNFTNVTSNQNVTANFEINSFTVSATASPVTGGSATCNSPVNYGDSSVCTATSASGYKFTGWSGACSGASCTLNNIIANMAVTATFTALQNFSVKTTVLPIAGGTVSCTNPIVEGGSGTCTAKAASGYKFTGWSGDCSGASCTLNNVTVTPAVTATFTALQEFSVKTTVLPIAGGTVSCTNPIVEGGSGTCTAKAASGYKFTGWSGDCSGTALSCNLANVTSAKTVSATFEQADTFAINVTLQKMDGSTKALAINAAATDIFATSVTCTASNPITKNTTVTCSANSGISVQSTGDGQFKGWGGDCTRVEGQNCIIENMANDKHLTIYTGFSLSSTTISPAGAGSLWCTGNPIVVTKEFLSSCKAEANPGYSLVSIEQKSICSAVGCGEGVLVTFSKQTNAPLVTCGSCTNSTISTDTSTTNTASKTSAVDANGISTTSTVAVTTDTSGQTSTSIIVNSGTVVGTSNPSNQITIGNGILPQVTVNDQGSTQVVVQDNSAQISLNASPIQVSGTISTSSNSTIISAASVNGTQSDVYNFEFTDTSNNNIIFTKPVTIKLPVSDTSDVDTDLLTLAKIINGKLEYYGGKYNADGKYFEAERKSFKQREKSADDSYAFISANWSEKMNTNLVMKGTAESNVIQHSATLDTGSFAHLQTQIGLVDKTVKNTLKLSANQDASSAGVTGNLIAGFAAINITGMSGTYSLKDKQQPAGDKRALNLAVSNGSVTTLSINDGTNTEEFYKASSDAKAPSLVGFESSADSVSLTLSYPAP